MARSCVECGRTPSVIVEIGKQFYCTDHAKVKGYFPEQSVMRMRKL